MNELIYRLRNDRKGTRAEAREETLASLENRHRLLEERIIHLERKEHA